MKRKFRRIGKTPVLVDEWSLVNYPLPPIREWYYSKHINRRAKWRYRDGTAVIEVNNDWYIHCCRNGTRVLVGLPF